MATLAELTTPLTVDEAKAAIYAAIEAKGTSTTGWKPGAVARTIIAGLAIILAAFSQLQALIAKSGFLELSEGAWLTLVALYVYAVTRDEGSFATGNLTLTNNGGGIYAGAAGGLLFLNPTTKKQYRNTAAFNIPAGPSTTSVPVQAVELGSGSTSAPSTITQFVTPLLGVTVTNAAALVGNDPESDAALRDRCKEKIGVLSPNGPKDAYAFIAKSAKRADGSSIGVTRVKSIADGSGNVTVYVADADGVVTGTAGDINTDLGRVHDAIQKNCVPLGVTETTASAVAKSIAVTYEIWLKNTTGLTDVQIRDAIALALTNFLATAPINGWVITPDPGKVYVSKISAEIADVFKAETLRVSVTVPAADVAILVNEAPVIGAINATIHQVGA